MNRIRCYLLALGICLLSVAGLRAVVADPAGFQVFMKRTRRL